jgi:hypothetical protein
MSATTVKLDAELLAEIGGVKPREQTLSAFVRESLKRELRRRKMRDAAEAYVALLANDAKERADLREWESARLATAPKRRRRK